MEAYIAKNQTDGRIRVKTNSYPDVIIMPGDEYMFSTPQEFFAFKPKLDIFIQERMIRIVTISEKAAQARIIEEAQAKRDSYKNDHITKPMVEQDFERRALEVKGTTTEEPVTEIESEDTDEDEVETDITDIDDEEEEPVRGPVVVKTPEEIAKIKVKVNKLKEKFRAEKDTTKKETIRAEVNALLESLKE